MIDAEVGPRARIVEAAAGLLQQQGASGVTTRAVAAAAGVQAPTIYRLFADKDGLMDAVAEHVIATFVHATATTTEGMDPVDALRVGWRMQVEFGLANPAVFALLSRPQQIIPSTPAGRQALAALQRLVHRVAATGRLQVSEARSVDLLRAAAIGTIQTVLASPPLERDLALADVMLDAVLGRILDRAPARRVPGPIAAAVALRALVPDLASLTDAERRLLGEWLGRVIDLS